MINIAYVVGGLLILMLAGHLHEYGGGLVSTVPLALLGLGAILKGFTTSRGEATQQGDELQPRVAQTFAEGPLAEEIADAPDAAPTGRKIPAKIMKPTPATGPSPFNSPRSSGTVSLNSRKFLNRGKTDFHKGGVNETHD